jgi:hypothetical protein
MSLSRPVSRAGSEARIVITEAQLKTAPHRCDQIEGLAGVELGGLELAAGLALREVRGRILLGQPTDIATL